MNILSFDIEEWHLYNLYPKGGKDYYLPCINGYLDRVLDLLDEKNYKATFYCVGIIARESPEVIRRIVARGHEIGCHSDKHTLINTMTTKAFREDTRLAIDSLQQLIGTKVDMYRAPSFSMNRSWNWALEILMEEGITCDSSLFPVSSKSGNKFVNQTTPFLIKSKGLELKQFPISYHPILGRNFIFSGGGFFRFFPYSLIKNWMLESDYNMTYFHIRDFDKEQKRFFSKRYFLSYYGISGAYEKYEKFMQDFQFQSVGEAMNEIDWTNVPIVEY